MNSNQFPAWVRAFHQTRSQKWLVVGAGLQKKLALLTNILGEVRPY